MTFREDKGSKELLLASRV